jgi:hypothetical protein
MLVAGGLCRCGLVRDDSSCGAGKAPRTAARASDRLRDGRATPGQDGRVSTSGRRPARQKSQDAMFCLQQAAMFCLHPTRQARMAGSAPAGGGPPGKNRRMRCFASSKLQCFASTLPRQARMAGSAPAGGGPPGKNRRMRCFASSKLQCFASTLPRQARMAGSAPAGGGPPGKNRRMRCFAYILKLNVCQRSRRSQPPTVRLPTWIRAVPRIPGVNSDSGSSTVIRAS